MLVVTAAAVGKGVLTLGSLAKLGVGLAMAAALPAVRHESEVDFEETAQIATEAFSARGKVFTADQMRWLYNDSFSLGTTVLAAFADGRKVGQIALIHQNIQVRGRQEQAVLLTDLFILEKYRSRQVLVDLFAQVLESCQTRGVRFILGMPNTSARSINDHFLKMIPYLKLDIRASWRLPFLGTGDLVSRQMKDVDHAEAIRLFERFRLASDNAVEWTAEGLFSRLTGTQQDYAIHYNDRLLAVSTRRDRKGVDFTLLCGLFPARDSAPQARDVRWSMRAACDIHRARLGIYIGHDEVMPALPGIALPDRLRPSPMTLDLRDLVHPDDSVVFRRYQGVDFDFA